VLYGGAAGGGKSAAAVAFPLKWAHLHGMRSLILRRQSKDLDDLIHKSWDLYPTVCPGASKVQSPHYRWTFPSGAEVTLSHCNNDDDWKSYDGWEINLLIFDELTHFTEQQYTFLIGRNRSSRPGLPVYVRATTNPGGTGHEWVFKRWGAWLNPNFKAQGLPERSDDGGRLPPARPGEIWHVYLDDDGHEIYEREPVFNPDGRPKTLSRTFIPAMLADNPRADQKYAARVAAIPDRVRRLQLRDGNWLVKTVDGALFKGVTHFRELPIGMGYRIGYGLDLAYSEKKKGVDWSVIIRGVCVGRDVFLLHMVRTQVPASSFALVLRSLQLTQDKNGNTWRGPMRWFTGGGGEKGVADLINNNYLKGLPPIEAIPATADKLIRAQPASILWNPPEDDKGNQLPLYDENGQRVPGAGVGHVLVPDEGSSYYGPWVEELLSEVLAFTGDPRKDDHDDIVDALAALISLFSGTSYRDRLAQMTKYLPQH